MAVPASNAQPRNDQKCRRDWNSSKVHVREGVRTITIHHKHPACILTTDLSRELATAVDEAESDEATRVIVFRSADPEFFVAHFDVNRLLRWVDLYTNESSVECVDLNFGSSRRSEEALRCNAYALQAS